MKNSQEIEAEFRSKLQSLITEYNAEVSIEDTQTYAYLSDNVISVYIPTVWEGDSIISESASFNFGDRI